MSDNEAILSTHCSADTRSKRRRKTRRAFLAAAAGAAGICYIAALAYPVYRYLASPVEMALTPRPSPR